MQFRKVVYYMLIRYGQDLYGMVEEHAREYCND